MASRNKKNNSDSATFGGQGFVWRKHSWSTELLEIWHKGCVKSEWSPLTDVTLVLPDQKYLSLDRNNPDQYLFLEIPNVQKFVEQCYTLTEMYQRLGVHVHLIEQESSMFLPNYIFQRDTYCATPLGVILGRPAAEQRRKEEVLQQKNLAKLDVPIIMMPIQQSYFEGADLLWIDENNAIISINNRSNRYFIKQLQSIFENVHIHQIELPQGIQHTLGILNFLSKGTVAVWESRLSQSVRDILEEIPSITEIILMKEDEEIEVQRALNWVLIRDNCIVMPSGAPNTTAFLRSIGVEVHCVDVSEYIKCGGAMGCATGILGRSSI